MQIMTSAVEDWVKKLDLPTEVAAKLVSNGFDTLGRLSKIKLEDCTRIGLKVGHARDIVEEAKRMLDAASKEAKGVLCE
jgi:hypothetical protein